MKVATSYGKEDIVTEEVPYVLKMRLLNVSAKLLNTKWPQVYHFKFSYLVILRLRLRLLIKTNSKRQTKKGTLESNELILETN